MNTDVQAAAPSAATETQQNANPYASGKLTREMSTAWLKGEEFKPKTEAPAASEKVSTEGKPESASASEAGKEKQEKGQKPKLTAEERIAQLEGTIAKIREGSKKPAPETKTAESSPAKPAEARKALEEPKEPKLEDYADKPVSEYDAALRQFYRDVAKYEAAKAVEEDRSQRAKQAQQQVVDQKIKEANERYPDFKEKAGPALRDIMQDQAIHPIIRETIGASPVFTDILYTIGSDADTVSSFVEMAKADGIQAIKYIGVLEKLIMEELDKGAGEKPKEKETSSAKTETSGPPAKATRTVGTRGTGPDDPVADAVRRSNGKLTKETSDLWLRNRAKRLESS